jgi:hypothetical protein
LLLGEGYVFLGGGITFRSSVGPPHDALLLGEGCVFLGGTVTFRSSVGPQDALLLGEGCVFLGGGITFWSSIGRPQDALLFGEVPNDAARAVLLLGDRVEFAMPITISLGSFRWANMFGRLKERLD